MLNGTLAKLNRKAGSQLRAAAVRNFSFGESVTVAGLLCGKDLKYAAEADRQAHGGDPRWVDAVVVPSSSLRTHTGPTDQYTLAGVEHPEARAMFLDDVTLAELSRDLGVPVVPGGENLSQLLDNLQHRGRGGFRLPHDGHELAPGGLPPLSGPRCAFRIPPGDIEDAP